MVVASATTHSLRNPERNIPRLAEYLSHAAHELEADLVVLTYENI